MFSCGTEAVDWVESNCYHCIKGIKSADDFPKCKVCQEIMLGCLGNDKFSQRTIIATESTICPYKAEHYPKRKKTQPKEQMTLF